jgi:hypothetical protein
MYRSNLSSKLIFATLLLLPFLLVTVSPVPAQQSKQKITNKKLPAAVRTAFTGDSNTKAIRVMFIKQVNAETLYEIETGSKGKVKGWIYNAEGKLIETEEQINVKELPAAVVETVKKAHPGVKIDKAEKVIKDGNVIAYEVEAEDSKQEMEWRITPEGKVLEQEKLKTK